MLGNGRGSAEEDIIKPLENVKVTLLVKEIDLCVKKPPSFMSSFDI